MNLIRNERIKLVAGALNNIGVATIVTAVVVPGISFPYGPVWSAPNRWWLLVGALWLIVGISLNLIAVATLGRLKA